MLGCTQVKAEDAKGYAGLIYDLAQRAAIDSLAKNRELLVASKEEWEKDSASYSFSAKRFGDFLTVYISRGGEKYASALNIGRAQEIRLVEGHVPDSNGELCYQVYQKSDEEKSQYGSSGFMVMGGSYGRRFDSSEPPEKGYHYAVDAVLPTVPTSHQMIYVTPPPPPPSSNGSYMNGGNSNYSSQYYGNYQGPKIDAITRPAQDDTITFVGIATVIYAPAGKGAEVRDTILAEIARGFEPQILEKRSGK